MRRRLVIGLTTLTAGFALLARRLRRPPTANGHATADLSPDHRRLVGIIAHELRTPTSVILGYQELLSEGLLGPMSERATDALERIRRAARQLRDLTDGLQMLTGDAPERYEAGLGAISLNETVGRLVSMSSGEATSRGVDLAFAGNGQSPCVHADPEALDHLVDLIIAAAVRAAPTGAITLLVAADESAALLVADGTAIDPRQYAPALLEQPSCVDSGLGLRLAIAQRIARSLGGSIEIPNGQLRLRLPVGAGDR